LIETVVYYVHELVHSGDSPARDLRPDHVVVQQDLERAGRRQLCFDGVANEKQHKGRVHLVFLRPRVVIGRGLSHHLERVPAGDEQQNDGELEERDEGGDVFVH